MTLSQELNKLLVSLVMDLHGGNLLRCQQLGLTKPEIDRLRKLSLEELHHLSKSHIAVLNLRIDHNMLNKMLNRAKEEVKKNECADRALTLGASSEMMNFFFGMDAATVSARRKIEGISIRRGRSCIPDEATDNQLWKFWEKESIKEIYSMAALEIMMTMSEKYDIPLGTIWARLKEWNKSK